MKQIQNRIGCVTRFITGRSVNGYSSVSLVARRFIPSLGYRAVRDIIHFIYIGLSTTNQQNI
jgi:hypothetical protein